MKAITKYRSKHSPGHNRLPGADDVLSVIHDCDSIKSFTDGSIHQTGKRHVPEVELGFVRHTGVQRLVLYFYSTTSARNRFFIVPTKNDENLPALRMELAELLKPYCEKYGFEFRLLLKEEEVKDVGEERNDDIGEQMSCGHTDLLDHLLKQMRKVETTAEVLVLCDLLDRIKQEDFDGANMDFQSLKVHLDSCDHCTEELKVARHELGKKSEAIHGLEQKLAALNEQNGAGHALLPVEQFIRQQLGQSDVLAQDLEACKQLHDDSSKFVEDLLHRIEIAKAECVPHFDAVSKAAQAEDFAAMQKAMKALAEPRLALEQLTREHSEHEIISNDLNVQIEALKLRFAVVERERELALRWQRVLQPAVDFLHAVESAGGIEPHWNAQLGQADVVVAVIGTEVVIEAEAPDNYARVIHSGPWLDECLRLKSLLTQSPPYDLYTANSWEQYGRPCFAEKRHALDPLTAYDIVFRLGELGGCSDKQIHYAVGSLLKEADSNSSNRAIQDCERVAVRQGSVQSR